MHQHEAKLGEHPRWRLSVRMSTVVLWLTAVAVWTAYYKAWATRHVWQDRMGRMEIAAGMPPLADPEMYQVNRLPGGEDWFVWVPLGETCRLRYAFQGFDADAFSDRYQELPLSAGRHVIQLTTTGRLNSSRRTQQASLVVDRKVIFHREFTREWNISSPWTAVTAEQVTNLETPQSILTAFGKAHLVADEAYDPDKHRFGLQIWLAR